MDFFRLWVLISIVYGSAFAGATPTRGKATEVLRVAGNGFSVAVPKDWYFSNFSDGKLRPSSKSGGKVDRRYTGEILLSPEAELTTATTYVGIRDSFPGMPSPKSGSTETKVWNGRTWSLNKRRTKTSPDGGKTWVEWVNWTAHTSYKSGQIVILSGTPAAEAEKFQPTLLSVMESVIVADR